MLSQSEETTLLEAFNDTKIAYPKNKNIINLFEEQVNNNPIATAITYEKEKLSYKKLNERSNQLARYLIKKGVTAETLVPICIERSLEMIVGIVGILKAGGVYVPIDPDYPAAFARGLICTPCPKNSEGAEKAGRTPVARRRTAFPARFRDFELRRSPDLAVY